MKILVTGSKGQLGSELQVLAAHRPHDKFIFVDVDELDITNNLAVDSFFDNQAFDVCINCAAYTAVDKAEQDADLARKVNVTGVEHLAKSCEKNKVLFVHISTDFVFDGSSKVPYSTDDPVSPLSVYGLTKAEGEYRALSCNTKTILIRTSWVYSSFGANFVKTMIRLGKEKTEIGVVNDQTGCPTWAHDLAAAILQVIDNKDQISYGIYHYSNQGPITWFEFASAIMEIYPLPCKVNPITTAEYPTAAIRPVYSVMDISKILSVPGLSAPNWRTSLIACINEIKQKEHAGNN
jgi:dTDP-4-dehydrorhamnose reductase